MPYDDLDAMREARDAFNAHDKQTELAALREKLADALMRERALNDELDKLERAIGEIEPPFGVGQTLEVPSQNNAAVIVDAIERAFDEWVVKVHFVKTGQNKPYYYPASALRGE